MKVNIVGKGPIPGINALAPVYNKDLDKSQIKRILNYQNFRVYGADGIGLITKRNVDAVFNVDTKTAAPTTSTPNTTTKQKVEPKVVEAPVFTPKPEVVAVVEPDPVVEEPTTVETTIEETVDVVPETVVEETTTDDVVSDEVVDEVVEEPSTTDEKPQYNNKKKKKKNHYNKG